MVDLTERSLAGGAAAPAETEREAARYRWLRDVENSGKFTLSMNRRCLEGGGAELDAAIDAAMREAVCADPPPLTNAEMRSMVDNVKMAKRSV